MKILTIHNRYKFRGGEDESREAEDRLLIHNGHDIRQIIFDNAQINAGNIWRVGVQAPWSHASFTRVRNYIDQWRPDLVDVHNFFPLVSPSVHYAAKSRGVPVVQTLHNYRLLCPGGNLSRDGVPCEDCTRHSVAWPGVLHRCYRESGLQSGAVALMSAVHGLMGTWTRAVSLFFVLSEFSKRKFVANGFPAGRMMVKPNFVVDPGGPGTGGEGFLYVGRLAREKGILVLLKAIELTRSPNATFRIVGDGPLELAVREAALKDPRIQVCGRIPLAEVMRMMAASRAVIVPSECYETFGRAAAEAFACGTPVICADLGAVTEIVEDGKSGYHFRSGDSVDLARTLNAVCADPGAVDTMRPIARAAYENRYTPELGYELLMTGYRRAIAAGFSQA